MLFRSNTMKKEFDLSVGFSDHTIGTLAIMTSVAIGANIIEKHFKDSNNTKGPDDIHSLVKNEFASLMNSIRSIEKTRGTGIKEPTESERKHLETNRVSIIAMTDIPFGTVIREDMIDIRRPGNGIKPKYFETVIGKRAKINIMAEESLKWEMIE